MQYRIVYQSYQSINISDLMLVGIQSSSGEEAVGYD